MGMCRPPPLQLAGAGKRAGHGEGASEVGMPRASSRRRNSAREFSPFEKRSIAVSGAEADMLDGVGVCATCFFGAQVCR